MTGLDRLRELADRLGKPLRSGRETLIGMELRAIADLIEAEQEERVTRRMEDREAAEWVREHGELDYVKSEWSSRVPYDRYEARRQRLLGHIAECETALGRRRVRIEELGHRVSDLTNENAELRRRAMPQGYEERVKRPAVLAADDEPLEAGQTVWHIDTGDEFHVSCFSDGTVNVSDKKGGGLQLFPSQLTHQRPVLDADGNRIETGMDVWWVCEGDERGIHAEKLHVEGIDEDGMVECSPYNGGTWVYLDPSELHVKKPVLDADGAPIHEGDTVYGIGRTQHVFVVLRQPGLGGGNGRFKIACHDVTDGVDCECDPSLLTHTKPEPLDTWDQIKADEARQYQMISDEERREVARRMRDMRLNLWHNEACEIALCAGIVCCNSECHGSDETPECAMALCDRLADLIEPQPITGGTSDGYHTFDELYDHRARLFSVIVRDYRDRAWKSQLHHDGTMYEGMFIVGVETPQGQATYHYDIDPYWDIFDCKELVRAPEWDGHTPEQAISRITSLRPTCDRDALLSLAGEMSDYTWYETEGDHRIAGGIRPPHPRGAGVEHG